MRRAASWLLLLVVCGMSAPACYRYVPLQARPQTGTDVRAQLTSDAAVRHSQGRDEPVLRYEGTVVGSSTDTLALDVLIARASSALQDIVIRDTVSIPTAEIQSLMQRKLSVSRTALFTVAAVAGAAAVVVGVDQVVGGTGDGDNGGDPTFRPPLFSWQTLRVVFGLR